jgi:hypothetical protein
MLFGGRLRSMDWEARMVGDSADLRMLAESFTAPGLTIAEHASQFFLGGTEFASLTDAGSVRERAREIVASISGASRIFLGATGPIEVDLVVQLDGGMRHMTLFPEPDVVTVRDLMVSLVLTREDGTVDRRLAADPIVAAVSKARESEAVRKVLRLFDRNTLVWTDLTVIAEVIQADGFRLDKKMLGRLTGSANHPDVAGDLARHGAPNWKPPSVESRISLQEARVFIDQSIRDWLRSSHPAE